MAMRKKDGCGNCKWFDNVWNRCANFAGHRRGDFVGTSEWCLHWEKIRELKDNNLLFADMEEIIDAT